MIKSFKAMIYAWKLSKTSDLEIKAIQFLESGRMINLAYNIGAVPLSNGTSLVFKTQKGYISIRIKVDDNNFYNIDDETIIPSKNLFRHKLMDTYHKQCEVIDKKYRDSVTLKKKQNADKLNATINDAINKLIGDNSKNATLD